MRFLAGFVAALALVAVAGLAYIYSGAFDPAASTPHTPLMKWVVKTTLEHSLKARASKVQAPASFTPEQVREGFHEFDGMCVRCHGAPGVPPDGWAKSMRPEPPDLSHAAQEMSPAELHWIVAHGIKMTGMPAIGEHESDDTIWSIVAFLKTLPQRSAADYQRLRTTLGAGEQGEGGQEGGGHEGGGGEAAAA